LDTVERLVWSHQIRRCAEQLRQDEGALGRLFDLTAPRLLRYASALTRHQQDAEDALQSAMVLLAQVPQRLADAWHPWAYLLRVVRNEALRVSRRRRQAGILVATPEALAPQELGSSLESNELQAVVREALEKLPPEQAEVLVLKVWEQMTFEEIADVLEQSPNTVASRYRYAIRKLTIVLEPLAEDSHVRG
jgi:RNA polymerase sigma-70 factor (ECF subfamily)